MSAPALRIQDLVCGYDAKGDLRGGFTLRVPELTLARGEAVALVGPSGCGKTTLLSAAAGILAPREGTIHVGDFAVATPSGGAAPEAHRRRHRLGAVGLVLQELELLEHLSVRDNLLLAWHLGASPCPWLEAAARAATLADALGIAHTLARGPRALSQGERQRVAVGRALATRPPLLLADEPTGNLDAANGERVVDLLLTAVRRDGAALLMVSHDRALWSRMDRVVELERLTRGAA